MHVTFPLPANDDILLRLMSQNEFISRQLMWHDYDGMHQAWIWYHTILLLICNLFIRPFHLCGGMILLSERCYLLNPNIRSVNIVPNLLQMVLMPHLMWCLVYFCPAADEEMLTGSQVILFVNRFTLTVAPWMVLLHMNEHTSISFPSSSLASLDWSIMLPNHHHQHPSHSANGSLLRTSPDKIHVYQFRSNLANSRRLNYHEIMLSFTLRLTAWRERWMDGWMATYMFLFQLPPQWTLIWAVVPKLIHYLPSLREEGEVSNESDIRVGGGWDEMRWDLAGREKVEKDDRQGLSPPRRRKLLTSLMKLGRRRWSDRVGARRKTCPVLWHSIKLLLTSNTFFYNTRRRHNLEECVTLF